MTGRSLHDYIMLYKTSHQPTQERDFPIGFEDAHCHVSKATWQENKGSPQLLRVTTGRNPEKKITTKQKDGILVHLLQGTEIG